MSDRESKLGFVPQKEIVYNKLLPYAVKLDEESQLYLAEIKSSIGNAILHHELIPETLYWFHQLSRYIKLYGRKFSKEDHVHFIHLLFDVMVIPDLQPHAVMRVASVLNVLLKKIELLSRNDLQLPWRPLYDLLERTALSSNHAFGMLLLPSNFDSTLKAVVRSARAYFSVESTQEMLDLWRPKLCPFDISVCETIGLFELFLCTKLPPSQHDRGFKLWLDEFIRFWEIFPCWENMFVWLFSRLAKDNIGYIDWEPYMPAIFTRLMRSFSLPGGSTSKTPDLYPSVILIVAMMGGKNTCQIHISRMLKALESFYHPSNAGQWMLKLQKLLHKLPLSVVRRVHRERYATPTWAQEIPKEHRLTDAQITEFVLSMKPVALLSMFSKINIMDSSSALQNLAVLRPELIIPAVIERLYSSLDALTEPHRLTSAMHCVAFLSRDMVRKNPHFPEGPSHVVPLLLGSLPGIDPNDLKKCLLTFQFLSMLSSLVIFVDCSKEADDCPDMTDVQRELCLATAAFEDFVLQFMDRCFLLIENSSFHQGSNSDRDSGGSLNVEENIVGVGMSATFRSLLIQSSPSLFMSALNKLQTYATSHILDMRIAGKYAATMCRTTAKVNPELSLKAFVPHFSKLVLALTENVEVQDEEVLDTELLFGLLLLSEIVVCDGVHLLKYKTEIENVLKRTLHLKSREGYQMASSMIRNLLKSLTTVYTMDFCSIPDFWKNCEGNELHKLIDEWGIPGDVNNLNIKYHVPSNEEIEWAQRLLDMFLVPEIDSLLQWCKGELTLSREKVQCSLNIVINILSGSCCAFPMFKADPLKLRDSQVPMISNCFIECGTKDINFKGKNARLCIVEVMRKVLDHMMKSSEDDTKSLLVIIKIYHILLFQAGVADEEFDVRWKGFQDVKKAVSNKLIGRKQHTRMLLVDRVCLQHELRLLGKFKTYFTEVHAFVMRDLTKLSVSHYADVRANAQKVLQMFFKTYSLSCKIVLPELVQILSKDTIAFHEEFKGALYVILGQKQFSLLTVRNWDVLSHIWPALVCASHSEKPSIVKLMEQVSIFIQKNLDSAQIELQVPSTVLENAKLLWSSLSPQPLAPMITDAEIRESSNKLVEKNANNRHLYFSMIYKLIDSIETGNLHWRHYHLAFIMLLQLVRYDFRLPEPAVRVFVSHLAHDTVAVRKVAISACSAILKQQKQKHPFVDFDPLSPELNDLPVHPLLEPLITNKEKPSNLWLHYNSLTVPDTQEAWNSKHFVHKTHIGFYTFPRPFQIYAPDNEQPKTDRSYDELTQEEQPFYHYLSQPEFIEKLIKYYSLEGREKFDCNRCDMYKGLFRNFGDKFLITFVEQVKVLLEDKQESVHRCAAEIITGILRGSKHWSFEKMQVLKVQMIPVLRTVLKNATHETMSDWASFMATVSDDRDPNKYYWFFEMLMEEPLKEDSTSSLEANWLNLLSVAVNHQQWRANELIHRILVYLKPKLNHPYLNVRMAISNSLTNIFCYDIQLPSESLVLAPKRRAFIDWILTEVAILMPERDDDSDSTLQDNATNSSEPMESQDKNHVDKDDTIKNDAKNVLQTICSFTRKLLSKLHNVAPPEIFQILPVLCEMKSDVADNVRHRDYLNAFQVLRQAYLLPESVNAALVAVKQVMGHGTWHARVAGISFLHLMVSCNLLTIRNNEEWLADVKNIVLTHLQDERVEVREAASSTLGGFLHCEIMQVSEPLVEEFKRKSRTKLKRNVASTSQGQGAALCSKEIALRHAGVLGLCACVSAFPYDVPDFMPDILVLLGDHLQDPATIQTSIKKTFSNFRRTHQDNWRDHKLKFTDDQLAVITDLLVSPSYYA